MIYFAVTAAEAQLFRSLMYSLHQNESPNSFILIEHMISSHAATIMLVYMVVLVTSWC